MLFRSNFLVKGCISIMMALINLFAFEDGDLVALRSLLGTTSEAFSSISSSDKVQEVIIVSSEFKFLKNFVLYLMP